MVELFFPFHLRLSIHAHTNAGPKFAISLLPKNICISIEDLSVQSATNVMLNPIMDDLLHIPTPWHNAVLKVVGKNYYIVGKAEMLKTVIKESNLKGEWNEEDRCFHLGYSKTVIE